MKRIYRTAEEAAAIVNNAERAVVLAHIASPYEVCDAANPDVWAEVPGPWNPLDVVKEYLHTTGQHPDAGAGVRVFYVRHSSSLPRVTRIKVSVPRPQFVVAYDSPAFVDASEVES